MVRIYKVGFPDKSKAALNNSRFVLGQLFQELSPPSLTRFAARLATLFLAGLALLPLPAEAGDLPTSAAAIDVKVVNRQVPAPPGYLALIAREPALAYPGHAAWEVTPERLKLLRSINWFANASLAYVPDPEGTDSWGAEGAAGDCEDFALRKLRLLLNAGVPRGAMKLAISVLPGGRQHAVLIVGRFWVLDSLLPGVATIEHYPGRWVATEGPRGWLRMAGPVGLETLLP